MMTPANKLRDTSIKIAPSDNIVAPALLVYHPLNTSYCYVAVTVVVSMSKLLFTAMPIL